MTCANKLVGLITITLAFLCQICTCQQVSPFVGQGYPPPNATTVYVTALLDRLVSINDKDYRFEVVLWMMFSWSDPRARPTMEASTALAAINGTCNFPCSSLKMWQAGDPCCDNIWMPHIEFVTARGFSQDRVVRYGVSFPEHRNSSGVAWWSHVHGEFYTPLSFSSFPFDKQYLIVEMAYAYPPGSPNVTFVPSSTGLNLYQPRTGDDISGWTVDSIQIMPFEIKNNEYTKSATYSAAGDPYGIKPADPGAPQFVSMLWYKGINVVITIVRISIFYVVSAIIPISMLIRVFRVLIDILNA